MKLIEKELNEVNNRIVSGFIDPFQTKDLSDFISSGSKRIRSSLTILYLKAADCEIGDNIYNLLAAGELIHNASLLHDDVLDNADTRRGKATISKKFTPSLSVLAGDYLLISAMEKLLNFEPQIIERFKNCAKKMTNAEIKQYGCRGEKPSLEEYIDICKGKTASLFSAILESCAVISHLDSEAAKNFGNIFGISFQIKNDLETNSALADKQNKIFTAKDIIGIENTLTLLDNYKQELESMLNNFPNNEYKRALEDLIQQ